MGPSFSIRGESETPRLRANTAPWAAGLRQVPELRRSRASSKASGSVGSVIVSVVTTVLLGKDLGTHRVILLPSHRTVPPHGFLPDGPWV